MATAKQIERRERIEEAAYAVLKEVGYKSASLLAIAKRASVSNETLYNWYGNKQALFCALVEANARQAKQLLEDALAAKSAPLEALKVFGPVLLQVVLSEKAIILNRAAASDVSDTATLGPSIAQFGRNVIAPLLAQLLEQAHVAGEISCPNPQDGAEIFIRLLIGDLQIRRVIGVLGELSKTEIELRAEQALRLFLHLHTSQPLMVINKEK